DLPAWYRDVLLSKPDLAEVVKPLETPGLRQYAYEMAVGVVNADGAQNSAEAAFLAQLARLLNLPEAASSSMAQQASAVAAAALEPAPAAVAVAAAVAAPAAATGAVLGKAGISDAEMDKTILTASITNAALELLPESIASMAIIPLQMRLVYRIGKAYGYEMDSSHARDFIATLGVGLTSQYVEQFGRKLLGGLLGGLGGGIGRTVGRQAASSGLTFATTYAMGRVAQRYYAGGRTLDSASLKETFTALLGEARGMAPKYQAQIEQAAKTIDTRNLVSLVRQG
ncbi:MAG: GTPase, partial [Steroidobacteraceae bacterium]